MLAVHMVGTIVIASLQRCDNKPTRQRHFFLINHYKNPSLIQLVFEYGGDLAFSVSLKSHHCGTYPFTYGPAPSE